MKNLLLILLQLSIVTSLFADDYKLSITNNTNMNVSFGQFKGSYVPSLCEDGPCWEEINISLRPLNRNFKKIRGTVSEQLDSSYFEKKSPFVTIGNDSGFYKQIEFVECSELTNDTQRYFYPEIPNGKLLVNKSTGDSYCLLSGEIDIEIEL